MNVPLYVLYHLSTLECLNIKNKLPPLGRGAYTFQPMKLRAGTTLKHETVTVEQPDTVEAYGT